MQKCNNETIVMQLMHANLCPSNWRKTHFPYPTPDLPTLLPSALVVGTSGSSGSPPAKQVGAGSEGRGKADEGEDMLEEVVAGLKEGQVGTRSPRPHLVHLILTLTAFWTLSDDKG